MASTKIVDCYENNFYPTVMLAPEQSRAGRAWLDWSQEDLAKRASVSLSTVRDFEAGRRTPIVNNLAAMRNALQTAGVGLLFGEAGQAAGITTVTPAAPDVTRSPAAGPEEHHGSAGHE